jgi:outer membrane lipoprotein-sorting protein
MRSARFAFLFVFVLAVVSATAQQPTAPIAQTPQRDPQAITILQQAVATMANIAPTDSSATGTVTVVEGSTTQNGSIQILTLGTGQTAETLTLPDGQRAVIYSNGNAQEISGSQTVNPPMQLIVSDQCADFPLPLILSVLSNSDESFQYVGAETLNTSSAQHVRLWNSFASKPSLQSLASFSTMDFWLDATSGLPLKIAYTRRAGGGSVPGFPVEVSFSNYTKVNGVLYAFQISKSFNGTPWETITIQSVSFNTGLTAAQFSVQ